MKVFRVVQLKCHIDDVARFWLHCTTRFDNSAWSRGSSKTALCNIYIICKSTIYLKMFIFSKSLCNNYCLIEIHVYYRCDLLTSRHPYLISQPQIRWRWQTHYDVKSTSLVEKTLGSVQRLVEKIPLWRWDNAESSTSRLFFPLPQLVDRIHINDVTNKTEIVISFVYSLQLLNFLNFLHMFAVVIWNFLNVLWNAMQ